MIVNRMQKLLLQMSVLAVMMSALGGPRADQQPPRQGRTAGMWNCSSALTARHGWRRGWSDLAECSSPRCWTGMRTGVVAADCRMKHCRCWICIVTLADSKIWRWQRIGRVRGKTGCTAAVCSAGRPRTTCPEVDEELAPRYLLALLLSTTALASALQCNDCPALNYLCCLRRKACSCCLRT